MGNNLSIWDQERARASRREPDEARGSRRELEDKGRS